MKRALAVLLLTGFCLPARAAEFLTPEQRREDFDVFCSFVSEEYAYFSIKATDWRRACEHFRVEAQKATDRDAYVGVLERALGQLYDSHAHLGTNTNQSPRLIPTQADLMAAWKDGRALITDIRSGSAAERAGVRVGDEVLAINDVQIAAAVGRVEPTFVRLQDSAARDWALRTVLAGRHDMATIRLDVRSEAGRRSVTYTPSFPDPNGLLAAEVRGGIGYVRIHNSLGEQALVREFDQALDRMPDAKALVIDLRDTPSGGVSSVARGMIGRLIDRELPYQRHELVEEFQSYRHPQNLDRVCRTPTGRFPVPVVVLVGPWTGSMGEGLAIGLNATRGAPVLGRPMAHLLGALGESRLPRSQIVVRVPVEKLFHVDGSPREAFMPCPAGEDELATALELAGKLAQRKADPSLPPVTGGCG